MSGDYLWDRTGPPDPEIERLERVLGRLRHRGAARPPARRHGFALAAAAAAAILLAVVIGRFGEPRTAAWHVASGGERRVPAGGVVRTGAAETLVLEADDIGRIEVAPRSELHVLESRQMSLPRGRIHALIWAPPRRFTVETPSARAVDLGCEYTLEVDAIGDGFVAVETGWVAFQFGRRESFIPAGAECSTSRRNGPGIPYFRDAGDAFKSALREFDRTGRGLHRVLAEARPRDGLSLWHLLSRAPEDERGAVFDRLSSLVKLPAPVSREAVIAGHAGALDAAWNALGLDSAEWWREWKREWRN
jgi:ferric-dicitrate binding protein FerR (iron transport regulator)